MLGDNKNVFREFCMPFLHFIEKETLALKQQKKFKSSIEILGYLAKQWDELPERQKKPYYEECERSSKAFRDQIETRLYEMEEQAKALAREKHKQLQQEQNPEAKPPEANSSEANPPDPPQQLQLNEDPISNATDKSQSLPKRQSRSSQRLLSKSQPNIEQQPIKSRSQKKSVAKPRSQPEPESLDESQSPPQPKPQPQSKAQQRIHSQPQPALRPVREKRKPEQKYEHTYKQVQKKAKKKSLPKISKPDQNVIAWNPKMTLEILTEHFAKSSAQEQSSEDGQTFKVQKKK